MSRKRRRKATSIKIDPELWKEVKIEAIRREMEVSELVELALRKELGKLEGIENLKRSTEVK